MNCPRCASHSILRNHGAVACFACGHVLKEPPSEPWDTVASHAGGARRAGPRWTEDELLLWADEPPAGVR
jgi:transcription initiation factor TFIIIB Brf1 subunit/transcription initiation factor TFIIB